MNKASRTEVVLIMSTVRQSGWIWESVENIPQEELWVIYGSERYDLLKVMHLLKYEQGPRVLRCLLG